MCDTFFTPRRIGFCCKWMDPTPPKDKKQAAEIVASFNCKGTTQKYLRSLKTKQEVYNKIQSIVVHNLEVLDRVFEWLGNQPINLRMMRIGSDIFPFYTHQDFKWIYADNSLKSYYISKLSALGDKARLLHIRISSHPGQYTILNSSKPHVLQNSIDDFEYHCDIFRWMGYSGWHPYGLEINVHGGSKVDGLDRLIHTIQTKLSQEARDWISIENDEYCYSIEELAKLEDICAILLDVHHHYINSEGEYIQPDDLRLLPFIRSWRGIVPEMHYSISPEEYLVNHDTETLPNFIILRESGINKTKIRAHSNQVWNNASNDWVLSFSDSFDIMVEAKHKNLSSSRLLERATDNSYSLIR
jgi:UV DNA damage endonuclease